MSEKKAAILEKLAAARGELLAFISSLDEEAWKTAVFASESDDPLARWSARDILRPRVGR